MAKLIPPYIKESTTSNAERKIFSIFQHLDYDCTVFHSLGIADHKDKVFGEIDFVVVSKEGILCLEIKGGQVYREDGIWHFIDRHGNENTSAEGPFNQVIGSMYSLREFIRKNFNYEDDLFSCQYACGVIFPDTVFNRKGPEFIPEIVFDARKADDEFSEYISNVFKYWRNRCKEKNGYEGKKLSTFNIKRAETFFRGNFGAIPSLNYILDEMDNELLLATEEQYNVLEMLNENKRVILKGGAGTGKTIIGLENAKRLALKGKKVLFLCYNRVLGDYLRYNLKLSNPELTEKIKIKHFHGLLAEYICANDYKKYNDMNTYYNKILPEKFVDYMENLNLSQNDKYDCIIMDEGQDLLRINYLFCIDEIIKDGLQNGNWYLFYDSNQNIFNKEFDEGINELKKFNPVMLRLNTNCRNTKQIGIYNTLVSGIRHEKHLKIYGDNVVRNSYHNNDDERSKLIKLVKNINGQGVSVGDIVVLSPYKFENSCLKGENIFKTICPFQNITGSDYRIVNKNSLKFCTIQSFKGMESRIIIIIDMDKFDNIERRLLNYTAISRAKSLLFIFYDKKVETEMNKVISDDFKLIEDNEEL